MQLNELQEERDRLRQRLGVYQKGEPVNADGPHHNQERYHEVCTEIAKAIRASTSK